MIDPAKHGNLPAMAKIVAQKPYQGKEDATIEKLKEHDRELRKMGYTTDRPVIWMRGKEGHIIEIAEWRSEQKVEAAQSDPSVTGLWAQFDNLTDNTRLTDLADAKERYMLCEAISGKVVA